jgi:hypothetical protein
MHKFVMSGIAAGVIGGAMLLSGSAPASAATLPSFAVATPGDTAVVENVQYSSRDRRARRDRQARRYDRRYHGQRYSYARPGFRHYYGGHYYSSPWWYGPSIGFGFTLPGVTLGLTPGYGGSSAHVQWCMNRYRTYDPGTDTYIPRVGERAYCNSPYN